MQTNKILAAVMGLTIALSSFSLAGCKKEAADGTVTITIGNWPSETDTSSATYEKYRQTMKEKYPNIEIIPDTTTSSPKEFASMASSGQLPNLYVSSYTELPLAARSGFALDITSYCKKYDYTPSINPMLIEKVSYEGKIYGIPQSAYALGTACNRKMFEAAGLVNDDGSLQYPATYEELAETAAKIKAATGKAGFVFPSMNNQGGWIFSTVAWSFGVDFMEMDKDGKWEATFNTPECVKALQYIKDLKWKYNVLPDNSFVDITEERKLFASDQAAMYLIHAPERMLVKTYSMNKDDICYGRIPAGDKGRYSLMGGNVYMIAPQTTPEQVDAIFKWLEIVSVTPNVSEEAKQASELSLKRDFDENVPIMRQEPFPIWINEEKRAVNAELKEKYTNVPDTNFSDYSGFEDVIIQQEEPECTQELYSILDMGIQEVLTKADADCAAIVEKMAKDFQVNHLDKM